MSTGAAMEPSLRDWENVGHDLMTINEKFAAMEPSLRDWENEIIRKTADDVNQISCNGAQS